jgi:uncharacterized membrane protein
MEYLLVKWLHILSSTLLFGTGIGSAFYLLYAVLSKDVRAIAVVTRCVVLADWLFTSTTVLLQPLSGLYMMQLTGMPMSARWIAWSLILYAIAIACWLPVVWIQMKLRDLSQAAARDGTGLPERFWKLFRAWVALGVPAFFAFVAIFYLMVAKPV